MTDVDGHSFNDAPHLAARRVAYHFKRAEADLQYALVDLSIAGNFVAHARLAAVLDDLSSLQTALPLRNRVDDQRKDGSRACQLAHADESAP